MKSKIPRPRLRARHLSSAGKSSYGGNPGKAPTFKVPAGAPDMDMGSPANGPDDSGNGAAFPMTPMAFPGGGNQ